MPATRELRRRIRSVKSTRQITKAIELVATAKMRRATNAALASREYSERLWTIAKTSLAVGNKRHPLLEQRPIKTTLAIIIGSDRGQAGAYNTALVRQALQLATRERESGRAVTCITFGRKIERGIARIGLPILQAYPQSADTPTMRDIQPAAQAVRHAFIRGEADRVITIYTEFVSALRQEPRELQLLPIMPPEGEIKRTSAEVVLEPSPEEVLAQLLPRIVDVILFQALQEAVASEHSARRMAMRNATDNASEMIDDLTLTYNSLRQGAITQEIAEITGGAAALT